MSILDDINDLNFTTISAPKIREEICDAKENIVKNSLKKLKSNTTFLFKGIRNEAKMKQKTTDEVDKFIKTVQPHIGYIIQFSNDYPDTNNSTALQKKTSLKTLIEETFKEIKREVPSKLFTIEDNKKIEIPPITSTEEPNFIKYLRSDKTCSLQLLKGIISAAQNGLQECNAIFSKENLHKLRKSINKFKKVQSGNDSTVYFNDETVYTENIKKNFNSEEILNMVSELDEYIAKVAFAVEKQKKDKFVFLKKTKETYKEIWKEYDNLLRHSGLAKKNIDIFITQYPKFSDLKRKLKYYTTDFDKITVKKETEEVKFDVVDFVKKYNVLHANANSCNSKALYLLGNSASNDELRLLNAILCYNTVKDFYKFLIGQQETLTAVMNANAQNTPDSDTDKDKDTRNKLAISLKTQFGVLSNATTELKTNLAYAKTNCNNIIALIPEKKDDSKIKQNVQRVMTLIALLATICLL